MTNAVKGALFSALGFPGLGQIVLKRYRRGIVLIVASVAAVVVMVLEATRRAMGALELIATEGGVIDQDAITRAVAQSTDPTDNLFFTMLLLAIMVCWVYAIVDAYRIGKQQDLRRVRDTHR